MWLQLDDEHVTCFSDWLAGFLAFWGKRRYWSHFAKWAPRRKLRSPTSPSTRGWPWSWSPASTCSATSRPWKPWGKNLYPPFLILNESLQVPLVKTNITLTNPLNIALRVPLVKPKIKVWIHDDLWTLPIFFEAFGWHFLSVFYFNWNCFVAFNTCVAQLFRTNRSITCHSPIGEPLSLALENVAILWWAPHQRIGG